VRALLWIVFIFALAAGLVVAARYNAGYVQVVWPPYRVELSLNLVLVLLAGAFAVGYAVVRVISGMVRLPSRVQAYRAARRRQKAQTTLLEALGRSGRPRVPSSWATMRPYARCWPRARRMNCAPTSGAMSISRKLPRSRQTTTL
jgi:uncharacterized membrane protein YciS (DUF1049 family)